MSVVYQSQLASIVTYFVEVTHPPDAVHCWISSGSAPVVDAVLAASVAVTDSLRESAETVAEAVAAVSTVKAFMLF